MKSLFKSTGVLVYFITCQLLATIVIMFAKMQIDPKWLDELYISLIDYGMLSKQYMSLLFEILYPALIAADIIIIIPMLIKAKKDNVKLFKKISFNEMFFLFNLGIVLNFIVSFVVNLIPETASGTYNELMNMVLLPANVPLIILATGILAPIVEEFVFRYAIIEIYSNKKRETAILISALMFGIAHFNLIQSTYAFILGLVLGYLYYQEKNLLKPIIVHLIINSSSVLYEFAPAFLQTIMQGIIIICTACLFFQIYKKIIDKKEKIC